MSGSRKGRIILNNEIESPRCPPAGPSRERNLIALGQYFGRMIAQGSLRPHDLTEVLRTRLLSRVPRL